MEACLPEPGPTLIAKDPARPALWYAPVAAMPDGDGVRIWYQRVHNAEAEHADKRVLCLGELRQGAWTLPALQPEPPVWGGPNNVCLRRSPHRPTWGGFNVFQILRDENGFRMLYWDQPAEQGLAGAVLASSADGRTWAKDPGGAVFTEHNDAFTLLRVGDEYLVYQTALEDWPDKPFPDNLDKRRRVQTLRVSKDLRTWTPQQPLLRPDGEDAREAEFYLMKTFAYGEGYLGWIMKYYADPALPNRHSAITRTELVVSRDARQWQRPFRGTDLGFWSYAEPFLWQGRTHVAVWKDGGLATVCYRPGRMVAVRPETGNGAFTTRPFAYPLEGLTLNADAREGAIEVDLLPAGATAPAASGRVAGVDGLALPLSWDRPPPAGLAECRLRIRLNRATLYAVDAARAAPPP